jgi:hypothetical protein
MPAPLALFHYIPSFARGVGERFDENRVRGQAEGLGEQHARVYAERLYPGV